MAEYVTDTQALIKFMQGKKVISEKAHQAFLSADMGESTIIIPAIVLMEVLYLFEKNRIDVGLLHIEDLFKSQNYQFEALSLEILKTATDITDIPELHDRLIAATARYLNVPIITNDPQILQSRFVKILE
jgi:predicted nucleic acid-binding protein